MPTLKPTEQPRQIKMLTSRAGNHFVNQMGDVLDVVEKPLSPREVSPKEAEAEAAEAAGTGNSMRIDLAKNAVLSARHWLDEIRQAPTRFPRLFGA